MTIRMLQSWKGLYEGQIVTTLSGAEETRLIGLGLASADIDGPGFPTTNATFVALGTQTDGKGVPTGVLVDAYGNSLPILKEFHPASFQMLDGFSSTTQASNQWDNNLHTLLAPVMSGVPTLQSGAGPNGENVLRYSVGVNANSSGRVGVQLGAASPANLGYSPGGLYGTTGLHAYWIRINLDATDSLDNGNANAIIPVNYINPNGMPGLIGAFTSPFNNNANQSPMISGTWYLWLLRVSNRTGGPSDLTPIDQILHTFQPNSTRAGRTTTIDIGPAYCNVAQFPSFHFSFDNVDSTIYTAYEYMQSKGITGTLYTDPRVFGGGNLTQAQVDKMYSSGWTIGYHGNTDVATADTVNGYFGQTEAWKNAEVLPCLALLKARYGNGWKHMAWPLGMFDGNAITYMKALGVLTARGIGSTTTYAAPLLKDAAFAIAGTGWFATGSGPTATWPQMKALIDTAINNQSHMAIWGHFGNVQNLPLFKQCLDYVISRRNNGDCDIVANAEDLYSRYVLPSTFQPGKDPGLRFSRPDKAQDIAYAATVTPDCNAGLRVTIGVLTGALTVAAPLNPVKGQVLTLNYTADAVAGRAITYNAVFKSSAVPTSAASTSASHTFSYNGTSWVQTGGPLVWL